MPTFDMWAISGRGKTLTGGLWLAWIMTYAHSATTMQYASVERSIPTAASCALWRCKTGSEG